MLTRATIGLVTRFSCHNMPLGLIGLLNQKLLEECTIVLFSTIFFRRVPNTVDHSIKDQLLLGKIGKHVVFCVNRRPYILWSPEIGVGIVHRVARSQ